MSTLSSVFTAFLRSYHAATPAQVKMVDVFLVFALSTAVIQFLYCALVGTFPFNSFLAGLGAALGAFVFGVSLRLQLTSPDFEGRSKERAFADFVVCNLVLFLVVMNFMG